jgi:hypothetical protein
MFSLAEYKILSRDLQAFSMAVDSRCSKNVKAGDARTLQPAGATLSDSFGEQPQY